MFPSFVCAVLSFCVRGFLTKSGKLGYILLASHFIYCNIFVPFELTKRLKNPVNNKIYGINGDIITMYKTNYLYSYFYTNQVRKSMPFRNNLTSGIDIFYSIIPILNYYPLLIPLSKLFILENYHS